MTTHSTELEAELDEIDYSKDAKEVGVVNMPNYYIIPRRQLKQFIAQREQAAELRGREKLVDAAVMGARFGNAAFRQQSIAEPGKPINLDKVLASGIAQAEAWARRNI